MTHKSLLPDSTIGTGTLDLAQAAAQSGPVVVQLHGKTGASAGNVRPLLAHYDIRGNILCSLACGTCAAGTSPAPVHDCLCMARSCSRQTLHFGSICRCSSW